MELDDLGFATNVNSDKGEKGKKGINTVTHAEEKIKRVHPRCVIETRIKPEKFDTRGRGGSKGVMENVREIHEYVEVK